MNRQMFTVIKLVKTGTDTYTYLIIFFIDFIKDMHVNIIACTKNVRLDFEHFKFYLIQKLLFYFIEKNLFSSNLR